MKILKLRVAAFLALSGILALPSRGGDNGIRMNYRFPRNETLRYLIERQDSLFLPGESGGKASVSYFKITPSLTSLEESEDGFRVALSTDSLWKGSDTQSPINQYEKMLFGSEFGAAGERLEIDGRGGSPSKRRRFIPFLLPLPGNPVTVDAAWNFSLETPFQKPLNGRILTAGDCQVYRIRQEGGDPLVIVVVKIEKSNSAEVSIREPYQTLTNLYDTADLGIGALTFNVSRGRMEKGVIQWTGSVRAREAGKEKIYRRKSRLTFRLVSPP